MWNISSTNKIIEVQQHVDVNDIQKELKKIIKIITRIKTCDLKLINSKDQAFFKNIQQIFQKSYIIILDRDIEVFKDNQDLLNKLVTIQNRNRTQNMRCHSIYSNQNYDNIKNQVLGNQLDDYLTRNKQFGMIKINEENQKILQRLQSTKTVYNTQIQNNDYQKSQIYKKNISKKGLDGIDYKKYAQQDKEFRQTQENFHQKKQNQQQFRVKSSSIHQNAQNNLY